MIQIPPVLKILHNPGPIKVAWSSLSFHGRLVKIVCCMFTHVLGNAYIFQNSHHKQIVAQPTFFLCCTILTFLPLAMSCRQFTILVNNDGSKLHGMEKTRSRYGCIRCSAFGNLQKMKKYEDTGYPVNIYRSCYSSLKHTPHGKLWLKSPGVI